MNPELPSDGSQDAIESGARFPFGEIPAALDVLPESGRQVIVIGDVERSKEFNHHQGDNPYGFRGTCGLVSCEDVLRQFGINVTEAEVVRHSVHDGLCNVTDQPETSGGTTMEGQAQILTDGGVPAHPVTGAGLGDLADWVSQGRGIIAEVNAGELWDDARAYGAGYANHAIVVTGAAVDPQSGELLGFYINDSGRGFPSDSGRFVSLDLMKHCWADVGGGAVLSDTVRAV